MTALQLPLYLFITFLCRLSVEDDLGSYVIECGDMAKEVNRSFFETSPLGFYQTTPDGKIIAANSVFRTMLEIPSHKVHKVNLNEYPTGATYPRKKFMRMIEKNDEVVGLEYEWRKKDGEVRYVRENAHVVRDKDAILYYEGTIEDVTDRKKIELELISSQQKLEDAQEKLSFLDNMSRQLAKSMDYTTRLTMLAELVVPKIADWCAIDVLSEDGVLTNVAILHTNPKKVMLAKLIKKKYPPKPEHDSGIWVAIRTGKPMFIPDITDTLIKKGAYDKKHAEMLIEIGLCSIIILPLIARGKTIGVITLANSEKNRNFTQSDLLFVEHISSRAAVLADNARLYSEALEEDKRRDHFLGIASHELKNALAGIKSYTQLLQRKMPTDEKGSDYLRRIDLNTNRLKRLMDDLIDLTKLKSQKLTLIKDTFEINKLVHEVAEELQLTTQTHKIVVKTGQAVFISADRTRISQVLTNLIKNAIKYSPGARKIMVSVAKKEAEVTVSVRDFGVGVVKEDEQKIFNLFYRADDENNHTSGLGVGLYISNEIIKMHKGKMHLKSEHRKGSTFSFVIPL
jgi:PAS domain S-box-containing protein